MAITRKNLNLHNVKRAIKAYIRIVREYLCDKFPFLLHYLSETHIKEQVTLRLEAMSSHKEGIKCLSTGECLCGCPVPALQYSDDACEGGCYSKMMTKEEWSDYKKLNNINIKPINIKTYVKNFRNK